MSYTIYALNYTDSFNEMDGKPIRHYKDGLYPTIKSPFHNVTFSFIMDDDNHVYL